MLYTKLQKQHAMATYSLESIFPSAKKFDPLISLLPPHKKYYEHSCNGLNLFMALSPNKRGTINSNDKNFIDFIKIANTNEFKQEILRLSDSWKLLADFGQMILPEIEIVYDDLMNDYLGKDDLPFITRAIVVTNMDNPRFEIIFDRSFAINLDSLTDSIIKQIINNLIINLNCNNRQSLSGTIDFSVRQGFISHFETIAQQNSRSIANKQYLAIWLFTKLLENKTKLPSKSFINDMISDLFTDQMLNQLAKKNYSNLSLNDFISEHQFTKDDLLVLSMPEKSINEKAELLKEIDTQVMILTENTKLNHQLQEELNFTSTNLVGHDSILIIKNF